MRHRAWPRWLRMLLRLALIGLIVLMVLALVGGASKGWSGLVAILPWIFVIILWLAFLSGGQGWITAWQMKRNNPHIVAGQQHTVSDAGYRVHCGQIESTIEWAGFVRIVETREFLLAYPQRNAAYYVPKRCLTPGQLETLRELFRKNAGDRFVSFAA
jgi:hypothetical protein